MRWPLRNQILLPMVGVTLVAIIGVSVFNAYLSAKRTREHIDRDLAEVADTLAQSAFPLSDAVLQQMRGLSGADFVLVDSSGDTVLNSSSPGVFPARPLVPTAPEDGLRLSGPIDIGGRSFFHTSVEVRRPNEPQREISTLHIYYPQESYEQAWRDVVQPPLIVAAVTMLLVIVLSFGFASRLTRPLVRLKGQAGEIAAGDFGKMEIPDRDDEVADLSKAMNQMADTLAQYEQEVRRHEQLRTLGQLGGGIAHQLRNSVTGCKLALELHARDCAEQSDAESLSVARRQLALMENYLQRFLALGKASSAPQEQVALQSVIESAIELIQPTAKHLGVQIHTTRSERKSEVQTDPIALEQAIVNVLLNGVEAASAESDEKATGRKAEVCVSLACQADQVIISICDSGHGPAADLRESLFDPFVSEKPDGVGLGLSVARETILSLCGEISWLRKDGQTCFQISLPLTGPSQENT